MRAELVKNYFVAAGEIECAQVAGDVDAVVVGVFAGELVVAQLRVELVTLPQQQPFVYFVPQLFRQLGILVLETL